MSIARSIRSGMKQETLHDWKKKVSRVIELMTGTPHGSPDLEQAASEAASSPWHFHRCFRELTGESFASCLRRLRLERAAWQLRAGHTVLETALDSGYDSPESFYRAFHRRFGIKPSQLAGLPWWKGELEAPNGLHYRGQPDRLWFFPGSAGNTSNTRIVRLPQSRIASLEGRGDFWQLPSLWEKFGALLQQAQMQVQPGEMLTIFAADDFFGAAFILREGTTVPPGMQESRLPGGEYAATVYFGSSEGIGPFWENWRKAFFSDSGWAQDRSRPSLEWYQNNMTPELAELGLTLLCDPVLRIETPAL